MAVLTEPPALIVADVLMPVLDGFEMVATLRQLEATRRIPVIFLTSHTAGEARGKDLGAIAYLHKPLGIERLLAAVAAGLAQGEAVRADVVGATGIEPVTPSV